MAKLKKLEVDRRVGIAMSVLSSTQKKAVEQVISSPQAFARAADRQGAVRDLRASGQPLYSLRITASLRLIYTTIGETAYVVDLVERATFQQFALRKGVKQRVHGKSAKNGVKVAARKPADAIKK